jgi:hypothetical protein
MTAVAERHYRVDELAELWRVSRQTIIRLFRDEPGVMRIGRALSTRRRRPYLTISIPESVALRVKARLSRAA